MGDGVEKLAEFNRVRQASTAQTNPTQYSTYKYKFSKGIPDILNLNLPLYL